MTEPQRILELWASLSESQRLALVHIAEDAALTRRPLRLSKEEAAALDQSRADFASGRVLSLDDAEQGTEDYLKGIRARA